MNIQQFVEIAQRESILDVMLIGALHEDGGLTKFSQAEGGPLCLLFESSSVMLEQPLGCEDISFAHVDLNSYVLDRERAAEEWKFVVFSVLELVLYPENEYSPPARIDRIVGFRSSEREEQLSGMILTFSTGGTMGVDTTSEFGLRYFLDGQNALFERRNAIAAEISPKLRLNKELVWQRE